MLTIVIKFFLPSYCVGTCVINHALTILRLHNKLLLHRVVAENRQAGRSGSRARRPRRAASFFASSSGSYPLVSRTKVPISRIEIALEVDRIRQEPKVSHGTRPDRLVKNAPIQADAVPGFVGTSVTCLSQSTCP
jgi:hypothetical protein